MTDAEVDLYADVVDTFTQPDQGDESVASCIQSVPLETDVNGSDILDEAIIAPPETRDFHELDDDSSKSGCSVPLPSSYSGKRVSLYVGNLTWWTKDADLVKVIGSIGVQDLLEVKFFENRVNGQSKGIAVITVGSDASSRIIMEKLSKKSVHGQFPQVVHANRQGLLQLDPSARKDLGVALTGVSNSGRHKNQISGYNPALSQLAAAQQAALFQRPTVPLTIPIPSRGAGIMTPQLNAAASAMAFARLRATMALPGANPRQMSQRGTDARMQIRPADWDRALSSVTNAAANALGVPLAQLTGAPPFFGHIPPPHGAAPFDMNNSNYRPVENRTFTESEFQQAMDRNKSVSSNAISRSVQCASDGDYATAIETLVTAISLIKQSKVAHDDRCKILVASLQDTLKGIEDKSYNASRSRRRSSRSSSEESRDERSERRRRKEKRRRSRSHECSTRYDSYERRHDSFDEHRCYDSYEKRYDSYDSNSRFDYSSGKSSSRRH